MIVVMMVDDAVTLTADHHICDSMTLSTHHIIPNHSYHIVTDNDMDGMVHAIDENI